HNNDPPDLYFPSNYIWGIRGWGEDAFRDAWMVTKMLLCEGETGAQLLRDLFGNPFRSIHIAPAWLAWNDGTVRRIAQAIYDERAFDRMPVLADALEDAGCTERAILAHCRQPGEHVRGCWVVDLILGKE